MNDPKGKQVCQVMTADPIRVPDTTSIRGAAKVMNDYDIGLLLVYTDNDLSGVITDRDIVRRAVATAMPHDLPISDIISREIISVRENDNLVTAAEIMRKHKVRRLVVLDSRGDAVGIITRTEILNDVLPQIADFIGAIS